MAKFGRKDKGGTPAISTASLPDIVFMLLFFFMVATTMREVELKIRVHTPEATEIKKLENKSLISYIYIGQPTKSYVGKYGTEPRIQLNDVIATDLEEIGQYITSEREKLDEADVPLMMTSLKIDDKTKMGIVVDIKQQLRRSQALKINYSTRKKLVK